MYRLGRRQAGLFSAVTSAFIIEVNSQLQPDPNEETAALLRVLIHKVDNTTFGDDVPSIPQWTGPPHTIVQVQAILFASLAASLFSAFLAMLGKQWVNRYASIDMRGSAIERSRNRQRKLDGVASWYFDLVMESLPLMLQVALLLLGFALSRYLWEINITVASVVLGVTSFGVLFFFFIVVAGAAFASCPYQTPGAQILRRAPDTLQQIVVALRHIPDVPFYIPFTLYRVLRRVPHVLRILRPVLSAAIKRSIKGSTCCGRLSYVSRVLRGAPLRHANAFRQLFDILLMPIWLILDAHKAVIWSLAALSAWLERGSRQQTTLLDLHCILWTLQTSLDGPVRLSALKYLASTTLANLNPALVVECFNILSGCVKVIDGEAVIAQGMEQLAAVSSMCCLQTLAHLVATDPRSRVLEDTYRRYRRAFPFAIYLNNLPFSHILSVIHNISYNNICTWPWWIPGQGVRWEDYEPPSAEHVIVARALVNITRFVHQEWGYGRVPRWILRFTLHSLSQYPLPPTSVVFDSLSIVAITLDCDPLDNVTLGERCDRI